MYFGYKAITIQYDKKKILENINMAFERNEITTIIGKNGCGKSSLLRILSNAVKPTEGEVIFEGKNLRSYDRKTIAKRIGILPQIHNAPADITVETLVSYGRYPHKKTGRGRTAYDDEVITETLSLMGLINCRRQTLATLSGGERQRAWIAMTLCQQPEILILDEPITYLDITYQIEILNLVQELNKKLGLTVIMVLHELNLAARYSHQLYVIDQQSIYAKGKPEDILTEKLMKEVFRLKTKIYEDEYAKSPYFIAHHSLNNKKC